MFGRQAWLAGQEGRLFLWLPLCLGLGIGAWLSSPVMVSGVVYTCVGVVGVLALGLLIWGHRYWRVAGLLVATVALGFGAMAWRAHSVAAPVLQGHYYGPIEGRVIAIDRGGKADRLRLTLDTVALPKLWRDPWPEQVRITLHAEQPHLDLVVGMRVALTGTLSGPQGAAEPGGFDFQRFAWFRGLGAVGYSRTPILELAPPSAWALGVARLRMHLSQGVQTAIPGEAGAFAAAMMTGDRSGMGYQAVTDLRDSGLYHLVSISGVHMSLLASFVFMALRGGIALVPFIALRFSSKKIAAVLALIVSGFYLILSGGDVATLRAFFMVAVMLMGVLIGRQAISLRAIALAALLILIVTPEVLAEPGFQMSFAATVALVMGLEALRTLPLPKIMRPIVILVASSLLAGLASAPFAAAHFNRFSDYGLLANLMVGPLMGIAVMPAGVIAAALAPFGLAAPAFWVLGWGCEAILQIGTWIAGLDGALRFLPSPPDGILPALGLISCLLVLLVGRLRLFALAGMAGVLALWTLTPRPEVLIDRQGALVGIWSPEGRILSKTRGGGFTAASWLEADGDGSAQETAAARAGFHGDQGLRQAEYQGLSIVHLTGKTGAKAWPDMCRQGRLIITSIADLPPSEGGCSLIGPKTLSQTGALALWRDRKGQWQLRMAQKAQPWPWQKPPQQDVMAEVSAMVAALGATAPDPPVRLVMEERL